MTLYAHTPREGTDEWHDLAEHLRAIAERASNHANAFDAADLARWIGNWHDAGKASDAFQAYLRACAAEPDRKHPSVDHKAAGALMTIGVCDALALLIQGHHGGLPNAGELGPKVKAWLADPTLRLTIERARKDGAIPPDVPTKLALPPFASDPKNPTSAEFFLRMLFSALVDADHADTERHFDEEKADLRGQTPELAALAARMDASQSTLDAAVNDSGRADDPVNQLRRGVYAKCLVAADEPPGLFRLTVPTGGGKTRSGLAFALRHARRNRLRRVVVAVPYLTITEQTVDVYRQILGDDRAVLEHHSGAGERADDRDQTGEAMRRELWRRLAAQDWNAPVVVTTTVQLFESLFGRTPSACRKLHRLARSVIILDEAQTLPTPFLSPILDGLRELTTNYGASVVLCTATQPEFAAAPGFSDLAGVREIAPDPPRLFSVLKRVRYEWPLGGDTWSWTAVAAEMRRVDRVLTIVNTKADALALLDALDDPGVLHLSTLLCGAHRREVLAVVRERLRREEPCRLVSTQVVEAGVDLDFPVVLRALGPLDRIVQAAGRCNREGRLADLGRVVVFRPKDGGTPPGPYKTATGVTEALLTADLVDPDDPATFASYFSRVFTASALDAKGIQAARARLSFEKVASDFQMIENDTVSVFVVYEGLPASLVGHRDILPEQDHAGRSKDLLSSLRRAASGSGRPGAARDILRRAQPYLIAVRKGELAKKAGEGLASELFEGLWAWEGGYDPVRGLVLSNNPEELVC